MDKYENHQRYGIDVAYRYMYNDEKYTDVYASGFGKLKKWLESGGKFLNRLRFGDILYVVWKDRDGLMQIIDREKLAEDGVNLSICDALGMTFVWEKRCNNYPIEDYEEELMYPEIGV